VGKYLDIINATIERKVSTFLDETKDQLSFAVTPAGALKVIETESGNGALERHQSFIETHSNEIVEAIRERDQGKREIVIGGDVTACQSCGALKVPSADAQIDILERWQLTQPSIAHWSRDELRRLRDAMRPGDLLVQFYFQSIVIRGADGRLRDYPRCQA
jgi:hypothetical protein